MQKKGFSISTGIFLAVALVAFIALAAQASAQNLNCQLRNSNCLPSEVAMLNLSNYTNAHAQLVNGTSGYEWRICCKTTVAGASITPHCSIADTNLTMLSNHSNAHVEIPGNTTYASYSCIGSLPAESGTVMCRTLNDSCAASEECLFTQSSPTNAHAGDCGEISNDPYGWRNCCRFYSGSCGNEGEACCGGSLCFQPYTCSAGTCQNIPAPSCSGVSSNTAKLSGIVTNITANPIAGAAISVLGKASTSTAPDGSYTLTITNANDNTPYDIVMTHPDYATEYAYGFELFDNQCFTKNFLGVKPTGDCNNDCTKADGLCHAECHGKGLCTFYSPETRDACDNAAPGLVTIGSQQALCCTGAIYTPIKTNMYLACGSNMLITKVPVLFKGKLMNMVLAVFDSSNCDQ